MFLRVEGESARLGERQEGTRLMHGDVAAIDRRPNCRHIVLDVTASAEELRVDRANLESSGVVRFRLAPA